MATQNLKPLDWRLIANIRGVFLKASEPVTDWWRDFLVDNRDKSDDQLASLLANRFLSGAWNDQTWQVADPVIAQLFNGYNRSAAAPQAVRGVPHGGGNVPVTQPVPVSQPVPVTQPQPQHSTPRTQINQATSFYPTPDTGARPLAPEQPQVTAPLPNPTTTSYAPITSGPAASGAPAASSTPAVTSTPAASGAPAAETTADPPVNDNNSGSGMMTPPATLKKFDDKADVDPTLQDGNLGGQAPRPSRPSDGSVPPPPRPDPQDMMNSHDWRHQRQPPIGARVQQILNWAQDEDVDRRRDFAREAEMAEAWVDEKLRDRDSLNLGPATVAGLRKCKTALMTHRLFQDYHQKRFLPTRVFNPNAMEPFRERLRYDYERPIHLPFTSPAIRAQQYLPLKPKPRGRDWPALLVNQMWRTDEEAGLKFTPTLPASRIDGLVALATDENALWGPVDKNAAKPTRDNNLSFRENWFYEECIAHDNVGYEGWVHPELNSQGRLARRRLWSGDLPQNDAQGFAAERGSRRAGLQAALRQLQNAENQLVCADGRMVTLPAEPLNREGLRKKAGIGSGRPLPLAQLPANQMQKTDGKADPQGFISNMAQFWTWFRGHMEQARGQVIMDQEHSGPENDTCALEDGHRSAGKDPSVLPPRSLWVPYVWRGVKAEKQINQDLLRKMRNLKKLFDREKRIAPRQLLANMESWYQEGLTDGQRPRLNEDRDTRMHNNQRVVRGLDEVELEWIRFLLNHSMSPQMLADLEPRTTLFIAFAERLARIFNDHSDTLFDSQTTSVSIEDLIDHMAKLDGPCKKTKFYPYDVKMWLGRLAAQGRCTYTEDWRTYGRVSRPRLDCHPEDLIVWKERGDREVNFDKYPEDMIYAPRFTDCRTWLEYIAERSAFQLPQLDANVVQYFRCLAYRWGYAVRMLQRDEEKHWHSSGAVPTIREMHDTLDDFRGRFVALTESDWDEDDSPLQDVWRKTLNKGDDEAITQSEALAAIRKGIIDECVKNNNMLYPGRTADYTDPNAARFREPVWDWAQPSVRGKVKKFFSLDRWPLQLQTKDTQQRIASDADVDPEQLWDPILEDPTPWTYYRPKARPYSDEKVKFRPGHRIYPIGDSRRQREVVKNQVMAMVGQSMGLQADGTLAQRPTLLQRLSGFFSGSPKRPRPADDDGDDIAPAPKLPRVDPALIPRSYDPVARDAAIRQAHADATAPLVVSADQVPPEAVDVMAPRVRPRGLRDGALRVEANFPLGPPVS